MRPQSQMLHKLARRQRSASEHCSVSTRERCVRDEETERKVGSCCSTNDHLIRSANGATPRRQTTPSHSATSMRACVHNCRTLLIARARARNALAQNGDRVEQRARTG